MPLFSLISANRKTPSFRSGMKIQGANRRVFEFNLGFSEFNLRMDKSSPHPVYAFEGFRFDAEHLMLYQRGEALPLAPKAAETLLAFIERRGKIVSKDELIERIWPDAFIEESNLFLYLSILRKTLGDRSDGKPFLETLRRRGYRFNGEVWLEPAEN